MKIEEVSSLQENGKYTCNACGKEYTRHGISTHYWLRHGMGGTHLEKIQRQLHEMHESKKGKPSWNAGLSASTDERVARSRETLMKRVESGEFMKDRVGVPLKDSTKEKLSEARSRFLNERGNGGFKDVKWFKATDSFGNDCSLRGSWERDVAAWLDKQGVQWTRKHYVKYLDESVNRTYSPDFFIPSDNTIIEVKGHYSDKDKRKMQLVQEQHPELVVKMIMKKEFEQLQTLAYNQL
jgi:hypothetical protein